MPKLLFKWGLHRILFSFVSNTSKAGESTDLWKAYSNDTLCSPWTFFLSIHHQNSLCCSTYLLSHPFAVHLWEESGSIFSTVSYLVAAGSKKVPPELSPRQSKPSSKPLAIYILLQPLINLVALNLTPFMSFLHTRKPKLDTELQM